MYTKPLLQICCCLLSVVSKLLSVLSSYTLRSSLLQENTQLTVPILDALSSLNLSSSLLTEVAHTLLHSCLMKY